MQINYIKDIYIPGLGEWSVDAAGDWLHPLHGPLPDHLGLLECGKDEFLAALWELSTSLVVMLESLGKDNPDPRIPMRSIDDVYSTRGWIIQTYLWTIKSDGIILGRHKIIPEEYKSRIEWREKIYRTVLTESVRICANFQGE